MKSKVIESPLSFWNENRHLMASELHKLSIILLEVESLRTSDYLFVVFPITKGEHDSPLDSSLASSSVLLSLLFPVSRLHKMALALT